jgi:hypothetical protein
MAQKLCRRHRKECEAAKQKARRMANLRRADAVGNAAASMCTCAVFHPGMSCRCKIQNTSQESLE